jgi:putative flippase GtrA
MKQHAPALRREGGQALRYAVAGVFGNVLVYLVYILLTLAMGVSPNLAFALSCLLVLPLSFLISRSWTFRSDVPLARAFPAFVAGYLASYLLQALMLYAGLRLTNLSHTFILPIAQGSAIAFFFALQRLVIFARKGSS